MSLMNIANIYKNSGKLDEALAKHEEALQIKLKIFDRDHLDVANSEYNIALLKQEQGKGSEAEAL
eukprot:CAMPEP_0181307168 /NCGR_PEP_ID=MMETSP1101-20121128/10722_1 /TAXON_ID=46948 /ORGANISM="Rhodomonas abbreviata, Strain Caron Lab Isolate" /LENGTH=64 /DNA_ID=CAMNT_0023413339 /DNA_START=63 /DNA_END=254 /DNA_ORIENTATION=+